MKKITIILLVLIPLFSFGQNDKKKENGSFGAEVGDNYVKFTFGDEKSKVRNFYFGAEIGQKYFHEYKVGQREVKGISQMVAVSPIELSLYACHDFNSQNTLSVGLSLYDAFLQGSKVMPTIIDYRYYFKSDNNTMFASAGLGYTLFEISDIKTAVFKLGLGYRFSVSHNHRMHISASYDLNKLYEVLAFNSSSDNMVPGFIDSDLVDVDVYSFNVKIGFGF